MSATAVSVIFSFRNEEETLSALLERLRAVTKDQPEQFEFIFVNDCSTDRSLDILKVAHAADPRVKVLTMARRSGPSECVLAGMAASSGDAVIYMDCDLQDPPEMMPQMLELWRQGNDVVHTTRTKRLGEPEIRLWLTARAYDVINWTSRGQMPKETGDFKLLSRRAVEHLLSLREHDPYLRGLVVWLGFSQTVLPYERQARHGGTSKFSGLHRNAVKTMISGVTSFSFLPVYLTVWAGLGGLGLAPVLALIGGLAAAFGCAAAGWLWAALAFLLWGSLMAGVGTTGLYVARIYKDVRVRPRWIVGDTIGIEGRPDPFATVDSAR